MKEDLSHLSFIGPKEGLDWNRITDWVRTAIECYSAKNRCYLSSDDKKDVCQNALERVVRHLKTYNPALSGFKTWVNRIAWNVCIDYCLGSNPYSAQPFEEVVDTDDFYYDPADTAVDSDRMEWLESTKLKVLNARELEAFELRRTGCRTHQIAEKMGITYVAASMLLFKAKDKMKSQAKADGFYMNGSESYALEVNCCCNVA